MPDIPFGTNYISTTSSDGTTLQRINCVYTSASVSSTDGKLYIGGAGLTLSQLSSGSYILDVIRDPSFTNTSTYFMLSGRPVEVSRDASYRFCPRFYNTGNTTVEDDTTAYNGYNLAVNINNDLILRNIGNTEGEESKTFYWAGIPMTMRRIGDNWYLVISDN